MRLRSASKELSFKGYIFSKQPQWIFQTNHFCYNQRHIVIWPAPHSLLLRSKNILPIDLSHTCTTSDLFRKVYIFLPLLLLRTLNCRWWLIFPETTIALALYYPFIPKYDRFIQWWSHIGYLCQTEVKASRNEYRY